MGSYCLLGLIWGLCGVFESNSSMDIDQEMMVVV